MKRLSRSPSSWMVRSNVMRRRSVEFGAMRDKACRRADDRGERRAQIVRDRGQQRLPQPVRLLGEPRLFDIRGEMDALDRQRRLVGQRIEQAAFFGPQHGPGSIRIDADHADGAAPRAHGDEEPLGAGQRVGAAAGGVIFLESTIARRRDRLRRAGPRADSRPSSSSLPFLRQQQHDIHFQEQRDLVDARPDHVVERGRARPACG